MRNGEGVTGQSITAKPLPGRPTSACKMRRPCKETRTIGCKTCASWSEFIHVYMWIPKQTNKEEEH